MSANIPVSDELKTLVEHAFQTFAELHAGKAPVPFVLAMEANEQTLTRLADGLGELDGLIAKLGDTVDAYAAVAPGDFEMDGKDVHAVVVEAEERNSGFAVRIARPFEANEAGVQWGGEPRFLGRSGNRLTGEQYELDEDDALLVIEALLSVMDADAERDNLEEEVLNSLLVTAPLFADNDVDLIIVAAQAQYQDAGGYPASLDHIERLTGARLRAICYVLAAEMAYVSGFGNDEESVLEELAERLRVEDTLIEAAADTFRLKYERDNNIEKGLLARTFMAMIMADGSFDMAEMTAMEHFVRLLPDFGRREAMPELADAHRAIRGADNALDVLEGLDALDPESARGLLVLAAEMAWVSDGMDPREHRLIVDLGKRLSLDADEELVHANLVFETKYG